MKPDAARRWLEAMADDAISRAGQFSECGPLPLTAPDGITAHGGERVIEFYAMLDDGTRITTTRPLNPPVKITPLRVESKTIRRHWRRRA